MRLDMYLNAKKYLGKPYGKKEKPKVAREVIKAVLPEIYSCGNLDYIEVAFEAGYWRKAKNNF